MLPARPPLTTPRAHPGPVPAARSRLARGFAGLLLVVPIAVLLAVGAGGPETSLRVLAPLTTFALPALAVIAFWWEDWPGTRLHAAWSGWANTAVVAVAGVGLTFLGQLVVFGRIDPRGVFLATATSEQAATYPATMAVAGAAFVLMLQVTLVGEGWPFRGLGRWAGGLAALVASWVGAVLLNHVLVRGGPAAILDGADFGALLVLVGVWQVGLFVVWRGWPTQLLRQRLVRLPAAHLAVLAGAGVTFGLLRGLAGIGDAEINAIAGCLVATGLLLGMQFEGVLSALGPARERAALAVAVLVGALILYAALTAVTTALSWTTVDAAEWVGHAGLGGIGLSVILHVAVGRRWPFAGPSRLSDGEPVGPGAAGSSVAMG